MSQGENRNNTGQKRVKTNKKNGSMDVRMLELSFIFTIANESSCNFQFKLGVTC